MSFSFDKAQEALTIVGEAPNLTESQREIISFVQDFIDQLHEESHKRKDELNRGKVWESANNIDILLRAIKEGKEGQQMRTERDNGCYMQKGGDKR